MKLVFVVGGSYKSFYLNYIERIKGVDLLIFNQGIFYDFDYNKERSCPIVSMELLDLNRKVDCPIVVYGSMVKDGVKGKCFFVCNKQKLQIFNADRDIYLRVKNKYILIGNKLYMSSRTFATISIMNEIYDIKSQIKNRNNYLICADKQVMLIYGNKIYRKFQKCCYFILKKNK